MCAAWPEPRTTFSAHVLFGRARRAERQTLWILSRALAGRNAHPLLTLDAVSRCHALWHRCGTHCSDGSTRSMPSSSRQCSSDTLPLRCAQGFGDGTVRLSALAMCALRHGLAEGSTDRELTVACHAAPVSAILDHCWQPRVAAVPLDVLVTGACNTSKAGSTTSHKTALMPLGQCSNKLQLQGSCRLADECRQTSDAAHVLMGCRRPRHVRYFSYVQSGVCSSTG